MKDLLTLFFAILLTWLTVIGGSLYYLLKIQVVFALEYIEELIFQSIYQKMDALERKDWLKYQ